MQKKIRNSVKKILRSSWGIMASEERSDFKKEQSDCNRVKIFLVLLILLSIGATCCGVWFSFLKPEMGFDLLLLEEPESSTIYSIENLAKEEIKAPEKQERLPVPNIEKDLPAELQGTSGHQRLEKTEKKKKLNTKKKKKPYIHTNVHLGLFSYFSITL